jgi:RimJ/RimL family protein N-acetyltransferase
METKRLIIRYFQETDWKDLYNYLSREEIYIFEPGEVISEDKAKEMVLERSVKRNFYALELKENKKMIGHIYFEQIEPKHLNTWEAGFIVNPDYQNKGYGTDALRKIIENGFQENKIHRIIGNCNPENIASWKIMEKAGMEREGHLKKNIYFKKDGDGNPRWQDTYVYGIINKDIVTPYTKC